MNDHVVSEDNNIVTIPSKLRIIHHQSYVVVTPPGGDDSLWLSEELEGRWTVEVQITQERSLVGGETVLGDTDWNGSVDTDLTNVDFLDELRSIGTVSGENSNRVTKDVLVDEVNGGV
ncbi:hypothetical protein WICPIJ_003961 [Wickerhamomyces pijperi]|uniref:Uncharacterized protein n=1 Tax=Wickerhamomyces pijperi TaxID=599730 RepID=A0A9P8TNE0_WICPI|nr:hypothetical protein WICPIJ_003961 [Wickerhamomyces pijperi]